MASDEKDEKWGTIFIDSKRESTLSQLDAMQAASRQEQWNQRTQQDYMEKVRAKAVERAREILGEAYTERQKVLEEAELEANDIRAEAVNIKNNAEIIRNEAQDLKHSVQAELDKALHMQSTAQEDGFQAGLKQAQEELDNFRLNMGASVAGVLKSIEKQSLNIFAAWRAELVSLVKVCVEKGTGLALDERYNKILENLVIEAVRNLDDRRHVTLRVHPDDEPVMADIFAAAKEKMPDLGQWAIEADPSLELGGLMAESSSGSVDSRLELFREMVDNILAHLVLPENELDTLGVEFVEKISTLEQENLEQIIELKNRPPKQEPVNIEPEIQPENIDTLDAENNMVEPGPEQAATEQVEQENIEAQQPSMTPTNDELSDAESIVDDVLPQNEMQSSLQMQAEDMATLQAMQNTEEVQNSEQNLATEASLAKEVDLNVAQELIAEQDANMPQEPNIEPTTQGLVHNEEHETVQDDELNAKPTAEELSRLELEEELLPLPQDDDSKVKDI